MNYIYISCILHSFINTLQKSGKKQTTELFLKKCFSFFKKQFKTNPNIYFYFCLQKIKPFCEIKSLKIGSKLYKIPVEIKETKQKSLTIRWLILSSFKKLDLFYKVKLVKEVIDINNFVGNTIKICEDYNKLTEINKLFVYYR